MRAPRRGSPRAGRDAAPPFVTPPYPPLYTPFKWVSLRLAQALRDSRVSSDALTVSWAVLLAIAAVAVARERTWLAGVLVVVAIQLDCLDGDLARCRNRPSLAGTYLEQFAHWIGNMGLATGAGAAVLLADPRPGNVLLASTLAVAQSVYIAVVRQVRSDAANIPEHPRLRRAFRAIIKAVWNVSPIELPLLGILVVFGVTESVVLALTVTLAVTSVLVFVPHFVLVRASDRRQWTAEHHPDSVAGPSKPHLDAILARFPEARWWTPGTPKLPSAVLSLLGRQPMAPGAPVLASTWRDLTALLPTLFRTSGRALPLACPEELALEAALGTVCGPADEVLVVGGRATIRRWRAVAERLGLRVRAAPVPFGARIPRAELAAALARHPHPRAVCLAMSESDDSVLTDLAGLAEVLRAVPGLVVLDACLSLGADELRMDEWGIDVAVSTSDSGVAAPPGLSLVALGPRALAALDGTGAGVARAGTYLDLRTHLSSGDRPVARLPAPALVGLYLATQMILTAGQDAVLAHRQRVAEAFRRGCAERVGLELVTAHPTAACTTVLLPRDVDLAGVQQALFAAWRMVLGSGSTPGGATTLQVGHAGWLTQEDVDQAVTALAAAVRCARATTAPRTASRSNS